MAGKNETKYSPLNGGVCFMVINPMGLNPSKDNQLNLNKLKQKGKCYKI